MGEIAAKVPPQLPFTYGVHGDNPQLLVSQQKGIYQDLFQAKTDNGFVGPHERRELRQDLRQSSRDIFLAKHNGVER